MTDDQRGHEKPPNYVWELNYTTRSTGRNRVVRMISPSEHEIRRLFLAERFKVNSLDYIGKIYLEPLDARDMADVEERKDLLELDAKRLAKQK